MPDQLTYLDHAATTPVLPEVIAAVAEEMARLGNPSSLHTTGRAARRVVEESRESIAEHLGCRPSEIVFTSGGTESDNVAIKGTWLARTTADPQRTRILVSGIEHHAVLDSVEYLVKGHDAQVTFLEPGTDGVVQPDTVRAALEADPTSAALVSVMWANNEVGTVQPVAEIGAVAREFGVPFHTDAVQALGQVPLALDEHPADLVTLTGHKIGGPLGVGLLVAGRDQQPVPLSHGGGQERQIRSGTLDTPAIAGLAVAVRHAVTHQAELATRLVTLRDRLIEGALALDPSIEVTGAWTPGDGIHRLPANAHLRVPGCDGDSLLYLLDAAGVQCSTGSACQAGVPQPSHVLLAMGIDEADARGALRLSLGHTSTEADVDAFLAALPAAVERARRARAASTGRAG
ncbi:cysteine desulfurase family protein [Ornithinicoccus hortensis]|uniref:Cysteine desulfurase n=1 Tax=Ornithinicoccus hortensis TaxID=82346 RepID=A0A542YV26_9MICO|nr:cysteine desulfurase family protein [Ornithinicoccus hortensis]TQL51939.1 cysteine desulfurase [Ornithinicoccus hortensis]